MKIIHVITSLRTGGAEKLMVDLLPRLRENGEEVELVVFDGIRTPFFDAFEKTGIPIHVLNTGKSVYDIRNLLALRKYVKRADIIHTHNTAPQIFAAIANVRIGATLITTEHNTDNRRRSIPWFKPLDKWMYKQYNKIICISKKAEQNLRSYIGDESDKIVTIFNGINWDLYSGLESKSALSNEKVITMVAAFRPQKDQLTLIKALSVLPPDYKLQLVGTGERALMEDCQRLVSQLSLENRVSFMGMREDVPEILQNSTVVVLSSYYEGLSLSSLEGLASGRPFIASDVDGLHEIVNGYGVLFPQGDASRLAHEIMRCCEDQDYAQSIIEKCLFRAKQFGIDEMAQNYCNIYSSSVRCL